MDLFRIDTIARNNNLTILQGVRFNSNRFSVYISRHPSIENLGFTNYIYSYGTYYIVTIFNGNINEDIHNFNWENVNFNNTNFPFYSYGITDTVYYYLKGLILT